jgi:predicted transcriptional regulator
MLFDMVTMNISLDEKIVEELKATAKAAGRPLDELAGDAFLDFLEKEKRRRIVDRGLADVKAGRVVDGDAMERWLDSWGTDDEAEPPTCQS